MPLIVVLGGPRSSKSDLAERLAAEAGLPVCHMRARKLATVHGPDVVESSVGVHSGDLAATLDEAHGSTLIVEDLAAFVAGVLGAPAGPEGLKVSDGLLRNSAPLVDAAIERLAARENLTVVVADDVDWSGDAAAREGRWLDVLAGAMQRLTAGADQVLLAVAGRPVEVPAVRHAKRDQLDELRDQTDVVVAHGAEDFANIVVDEGPPEWLQAVLRDALENDIRRYPDEREAIETIAAHHGRDSREVVLTNGAVDACWLLAATLQPRYAVCIGPTFVEPEVALGAFGHNVHRVARERASAFALDPAVVPTDCDHVTLGNPNNPTGTLDSAATIRAIAKPGRIVVVDEAFMEFVPGERESVANESIAGVVVLRSVTKLLGVPGLRVGYLLAPPDLADRLRARRAKWAVNSLALAALTAWGRRPGAGEEVARRIGRWRRDLVKRIAEIDGVHVYPSAANFLLANVPNGPAILSHLTEMGFAVRPAGSFPGLSPDDIRITVRTPAANARLACALGVAVATSRSG